MTTRLCGNINGKGTTMARLENVFSEKKIQEVEKEDGTKEQKVYHVVRSFPVFNWDQTEGVPKKEAGPALDPDRDLIEVCNFVLSGMSGSAAYYLPKDDLVNLPPIEMFQTSYAATKFHEYGYATGHESRLNRTGIMAVAAFGSEDYSFEEMVAELTST